MGDLGHVPRSRGSRPDDVRADDGRQLDLHRHAGHPAGHLRDARRSSPGATSAARSPARVTVTAGLGGMGGAQPLAVTMNEGVALVVEVDPAAHRAPARHAATSTRAPTTSTTRSHACGAGAATARARSIGAARQRRRRAAGAGARAASRPTSSPIRPRRTIRWSATSRTACRSPTRRGCARPTRPSTSAASIAAMGRARRGDARDAGARRDRVRLRQQHPRAGGEGRRHRRVRDSRLRARVHPAAVLRRQGPVPLGRAVGRSGRHPRHRSRRARDVRRRRAAVPLDSAGRRARRSSRDCRRASAGSATAIARGSACASTSWCATARSRRRS